MKTIYEKPVRQLLTDYITGLNLAPDQIVDRSQIINWFKQKYPKVPKPNQTGGFYFIFPSRSGNHFAIGKRS
jgi:hypothetical protein